MSYGEVAQLARAFGSYPKCHVFESHLRYQLNNSKIAYINRYKLFFVTKLFENNINYIYSKPKLVDKSRNFI